MSEKEILNNKITDLVDISNDIIDFIDDDKLQKEVTNILDKIKNSRVSIGVTGVIKAGKSTLLNAILHKDILGTSIVPETANLTIIKYSDKESAKVFFWNKKEWQNIVDSSKYDQSLKEWIDKTNENIPNLSDYIKDNALVKDISIDELPKYTSAKKKYSSLCNLVKYVELFSPLKYAQNGVDIIDTPGIDDPVIRREQITQKFLENCDVMIHAMNASQAFTNKDATFIIDNILSKNIYKLLLVITRKDDVDSDELKSVISNVEENLRKKFDEYKDGNEVIQKKFKNILDKIEIIAISGKDALNHRIEKSDKTNLSLEDSGIEELEEKLDTLLFKENPKYEILFKSSKEELLNITNSYIEILNFEEDQKSKSVEELEEQRNELSGTRVKYREESQLLLSNIKDTKENFRIALEKIYKNSINSISHLNEKIYDKIDDYLDKSFASENKPDEEKIQEMLEIAIKSNILEILNQHQENLIIEVEFYLKDMSMNYKSHFNNYQLPIILEEYNFDIEGDFLGKGEGFAIFGILGGGLGTAIGGITLALGGPFTVIAGGLAILGGVFGLLIGDTEKDQIKLKEGIKKSVKDELSNIFIQIEKDLDSKLLMVNSEILNKFDEISNQPYNKIMYELEEFEKNLSKQIELTNKSEKELSLYRAEMLKKHQMLNPLISKLVWL